MSVPDWMDRAVVILPSGSLLRPGEVVRIATWRTTKTQLVVTLDTPKRDVVRFHLDGLVAVGARPRPELVDSAVAKKRIAHIRAKEAVLDLESTMAASRLAPMRSDPEQLAVAIGRIQRAATKALASLADLL